MKKTLLAFAFLSTISSVVNAELPNWTYAQGAYANMEIDGLDDLTFRGFGITGSYQVNDNVYTQASYFVNSDELFRVDVDITTADVELGYKRALSDNSEWYVGASYEYLEADIGGMSEDEDGFGLKVGARSMLSEALEVDFHFAYANYSEESEILFSSTFMYNVIENLSLGFGVELAEEREMMALNARYSF